MGLLPDRISPLSMKRSNILPILLRKMSFFYNQKSSKSSTFAIKLIIALADKMESFKIIKPSPHLVPYIRYYWILQIDGTTPVRERTLPVGCVNMVFHRANTLFSLTEKSLQPTAFISGQSTSYSEVESTGPLDMIFVVFQPYAARIFFQIPISEFHEKNVSISAIGDPELKELEKQVADTMDDSRSIGLIEHFLLSRLHSFSTYNVKRVVAAVQEINQQSQPTITQLSQIACLSNKQFNRVFTEYIGTHPKEFIRIVRMQRALYLLQTHPDRNFAQLAFECGFYDQSHLIREFKSFSGYTPTEYLSVCAPYSDYFSVV